MQKGERIKAAISFSDRGRDHDGLTRAALAHIFSAVERGQEPFSACRELFPNDERALAIVSRSAVTIGTTAGWGAPVVGNAVTAFVGTLALTSAIARIIPLGITVSLDGYGSVSLPRRAANPVNTAGVAEGQPIPVRANTLSQVSISPGKAAVISVISKELAKRGNGQAAIETILREDAGATLDGAYLGSAAASDLPAGLLYGVTPIVPDTFGDPQSVKRDLSNVAAAAAANGSGDVVLIVSPARAAKIKVYEPNLSIPVLSSIAVPETRIIAIDPAALVHGFGGNPEIEANGSATVHMDSEPLPIVQGAAVAAPVRSMFQTDSISLRMILDLAFAKRSATAVAYLDDVTGW